MNGWGSVFLTITADGVALPCHEARQLPGLAFPNVREAELGWIWNDSPGFNAYRGDAWMQEPCRTCPEKSKDFGGCRCQAYLLTGDATNADPACDLSPHHHVIKEAVAQAQESGQAGYRAPDRVPRRQQLPQAQREESTRDGVGRLTIGMDYNPQLH